MYRALIVDQFMESRLQLQRVAEHVANIREVVSVHDLKEAQGQLSLSPFHLVFISDAFGEEDIAVFIEKARLSPGGAHSAYVLLLKPDSQHRSAVSNGMILGAHGFLCHPFTVSAFEDATVLALKVALQNSKSRLRTATGLMLTNIVEEFQERDKKDKDEIPKDLWQQVQESCETYKRVTGDSITNVVVNALHKVSPSKRIASYNGASKRVRQMFAVKFKKRLRALSQFKTKA